MSAHVFSLSDDKPVQEEDWVVCQHPECHERRRASKVGHQTCCVTSASSVNISVLMGGGGVVCP